MSLNLKTNANPFDVIRRSDDRVEYWSARVLMLLMGYKYWTNFAKVIKRAELSIVGTGLVAADHVRQVSRMVLIGNGAMRETLDYRLSRHACNLVAMNGDPRKPAIAAAAQGYFSAMTMRAQDAGRPPHFFAPSFAATVAMIRAPTPHIAPGPPVVLIFTHAAGEQAEYCGIWGWFCTVAAPSATRDRDGEPRDHARQRFRGGDVRQCKEIGGRATH